MEKSYERLKVSYASGRNWNVHAARYSEDSMIAQKLAFVGEIHECHAFVETVKEHHLDPWDESIVFTEGVPLANGTNGKMESKMDAANGAIGQVETKLDTLITLIGDLVGVLTPPL